MNARSVVSVTLLVLLMSQSPASAQIAEQVFIYGQKAGVGGGVLRFSRKLSLLGFTKPSPVDSLGKASDISRDATGLAWAVYTPLGSNKHLLPIDSSGVQQPLVSLSHNPINIEPSADGRKYVLTRIPLSGIGPAYCVDAQGAIAWVNGEGPLQYSGAFYPGHLAITPPGEIWIGGVSPLGGQWWKALIVRIDPDDGHVVQTQQLPWFGASSGDELLAQLAAAPDGTLWAMHAGPASVYWTLVQVDGRGVLNSFEIPGAGGGGANPADLRVDGLGRVLIRGDYNTAVQPPTFGDTLRRYLPGGGGALDAEFQFGGYIRGLALGPTGEEAFAVVTSIFHPLGVERLERVHLVTGVKSSVPLTPAFTSNMLPVGDPTGFIFANVNDRYGDNDGDGFANGVETAVGSSPFDPASRPSGPKVYVRFAPSNNALILTFADPDGLLDAAGGLDLATLSVKLGPYGEVWNFLLPFLTFVDVSPDLTEATALFGALPLPTDAKWELEASVADRTGAVGWDWQVTPPGDL